LIVANTRSLRAQRSNLIVSAQLSGDRFAALVMTEVMRFAPMFLGISAGTF
jgi:hypothetical protein